VVMCGNLFYISIQEGYIDNTLRPVLYYILTFVFLCNCTLVVSPPVIMQNPKNVDIMSFGVAKFQCIAKGYRANITWQKHDSSLPKTSRIYDEKESEDKIKSILEIRNVFGYYSGIYCCFAYNKAGNVLSCANLTVNGNEVTYR